MFSNVADVSDKVVSSWEQNKSITRMESIQKMADFFGIPKSDIIEPPDAKINGGMKTLLRRREFF
ncbi:MAG: helix-turn-helix domain-containing protein [Selenomonadaceae bacterium]|nr:helix-turn-helix domain-containing protein [Selenomonadaceae bacterium]